MINVLNHTKLYSAKNNEGLSLPRLDWYHYSFTLAQLVKINLPLHKAPAWVEIEKETLEPFRM